MQLRALLFLVFSVFVLLGCQTKIPELSLADIRVPDPERDLRRELGVTKVIQFSDYFERDSLGIDTFVIQQFNSNGDLLSSYRYGFYEREFYKYNASGWVDSFSQVTDYVETRKYSYALLLDKMCLTQSWYWGDTIALNYYYDQTGRVNKLHGLRGGEKYLYDETGRLKMKIRYPTMQQWLDMSHFAFMVRGPVWVYRYYYTGNGVFLDSIVKRVYDIDGYKICGSTITYYGELGFPSAKIEEDREPIFYQSVTGKNKEKE